MIPLLRLISWYVAEIHKGQLFGMGGIAHGEESCHCKSVDDIAFDTKVTVASLFDRFDWIMRNCVHLAIASLHVYVTV